MSKNEKDRLHKARDFVDDVVAEARRISWPTWGELVESTIVVLVSVVILAAFVGLSDMVLVEIVNFIVS